MPVKVELVDSGQDGDPNDKNNADADEDGPPKFDPTKFSWTNSDGNPKDIAQIYNELKTSTTV